ncbi:hypothetical protein QZH41_011470 [Actinostola sp. cb2023]|nr:hypothetical protein QZH41_011470 [Actinostola sp. cb2023]
MVKFAQRHRHDFREASKYASLCSAHFEDSCYTSTDWVKKGNGRMFDVTMGSYDGAEVCDLIGLYILNSITTKYGKENIGLYRDDGLAVFKNISGPQAERIMKDITKHFKEHGLNKDNNQSKPEHSELPRHSIYRT